MGWVHWVLWVHSTHTPSFSHTCLQGSRHMKSHCTSEHVICLSTRVLPAGGPATRAPLAQNRHLRISSDRGKHRRTVPSRPPPHRHPRTTPPPYTDPRTAGSSETDVPPRPAEDPLYRHTQPCAHLQYTQMTSPKIFGVMFSLFKPSTTL